MMTLNKRLEILEQKKEATQLPDPEIVFVNSKEQVDHPERFRKVLESDEPSESGVVIKHYRLERIDENN